MSLMGEVQQIALHEAMALLCTCVQRNGNEHFHSVLFCLMGHKGRAVKSHLLSQRCDIIFPLKHQKTHSNSKNIENRI